MDKIYLNQMMFYGYHGLFPEERKLGQRFSVDLILELDLSKPGKTDQMEHSINYGAAYKLVKEIVEGEAVNLVEALAENIATQLLLDFSLLQACNVKVYKPDPPIPGHYQSVAVEIYRERKQ
ncbi:dihydroneopterin aldolase [Gracilibacillus oryzae]|uniref:7,8-dihydroneopterin aldolase n=1 Tax=Gracilibacillus oryzae TaxID=1672701 RepID=A0A7C8GQH5_9BACI|nr:dihydroneopterin aldolase [Gracilibacillus oryzae]KAB8126415.1 dihydroneopterin aldolase [Gracilibacillus oryzae]